ncbi:MAG: putative bifunctional diguanylate cyclase/phosphodiesterase [Roseobacter sp.]
MQHDPKFGKSGYRGQGVMGIRRPTRVVTALALFLTLSAGMSFFGYHYLQLSSEYRMRNFTHLSAVNKSLEALAQSPILRPQSIAEVREYLTLATQQVDWCVTNLTSVEKQIFQRLGGGPALEICTSNQRHSEHAVALLERIEDDGSMQANGPNSAFALALQLKDVLREMRLESEEFHPFVNLIEARISVIVRYGTAAGTLILMLLVALVSKQMLKNWQLHLAQTREIKKFHSRFSAAVYASRDGFALLDKDGFLITSNEKFRRLMSPEQELVRPGMNIATIFRRSVLAGHYANVQPEDHTAFIRNNVDWMRSEAPKKRFELTGDRHIDVKVDKTDAGDNVIAVNDVTEFHRNNRRLNEHMNLLVKANREIEFRSLHDPLTNLANRRCLDEAISQTHGQTNVMLHLDLDRFKQINDLMGHSAGDFVLKHVAEILTSSVREDDLVARVGGDEFAILCRPMSTVHDATKIAERILEKFHIPVSYQGKPCHLGTSIGIATAKDIEAEGEELLNKADAALYEAKENGKGRMCVFTPELNERIKKDRDLTQRFEIALDNGEFEPYYQSQHNADDWLINGVEVLARWNHPEHGVLTPNRFLHIARQLGLENELDAVIFDAALLEINQLDADDMHLRSVSFNVSAGRILDPKFAKTASEKIPFPRDRFGFEILETVSVEDLGAPLTFAIDALRDLGFRIEIDDFGSCHASIKSVLDLSPNALKIDRALVRPVEESEQARRMITSIIDIGKALDVKIIAEGVETERQAIILGEMECHTLQGFYFSKPTAIDGLRDLISKNSDRTHAIKSG